MQNRYFPVSGRIQFMRRTGSADADKVFDTVMALPSADQYSRPSIISVVSAQPLGNPGDVVSILCKLDGFPRTWETKDPSTGYPVKHFSANNQVVFVQHAQQATSAPAANAV